MPSHIINPVIKTRLSSETCHLDVTQPLGTYLEILRGETHDEAYCSGPSGLRCYSTWYVLRFDFSLLDATTL